MDTLLALRNRRSLRIFSDQPLSRQVLEQAVDAARFAPTARNEQPWEFIAILDREGLRQLGKLADHGRFIAGAAACVVVVCKDTKYYLEDGVAAVVNCLTALEAQGIGACWVAGDKKPYAPDILSLLKVPERFKLIALIACGYSAGPTPRPAKRSLEDVFHWEQYQIKTV